MSQEVKDTILRRVVYELLNSTKTSNQILEGIVANSYFNKLEASLIYIEALEKIVQTLREVGEKQRAKEKQLKRLKKRK